MATQDLYIQQMADYYNLARVPAQPGAAAGFQRDVEANPNHWARALIADIHRCFQGKRVLEVACGMGRWTQFVADVAERVVATDVAPNLLSNAAGLALPADKVEFRQVDAFDLEAVEGDFDAAIHLNFCNHLPQPLFQRFNQCLHECLGPGKLVLAAGQQYSKGWKERMYPKPGSPDTFSIRDEEGFHFEIVDNEFDKDRLQNTFGPHTTNLRIEVTSAFWWVTYLTP